MISPLDIERIRSAANIVDVVSEYVTLRRAGASYRGLCPFHDDTTPSFSVSPARGICKCFACGEGGDVVHFIMKQEQLGYYDALRFLAKKYGIEIQERELTEEERRSQNERESMFAVNEWASHYFHNTLLQSEEGQNIGLAYFRSRGFRDDIVEKFRLGFSPTEYDIMSKAALQEGYKEEYLLKTGLSIKRDNGTLFDKYHGRVIFPWFSISGKIVGFGGRVLDTRTKGVNQKYINSAESDIYHKAKELFGLFQAKKAISKEHTVFMVEGYTDVISMHQSGIENVVANSGTALSEDQISILHRFTNNITLLYDGDAAGQKAALRGTDMLLAHGMRVKILLLPDNEDPDSFARKHNATEFRDFVESHQVDFITFKTNLLLSEAKGDPDKMSDLVHSIVESIAVVPEEIERAAYIHRCSETLNVKEQILLNAVLKTRQRNEEQKARDREYAEMRKKHEESNAGKEGDLSEQVREQVNLPEQQEKYETFFVSDEEKRLYQTEQLLMQLIIRSGEQNIQTKDASGNIHNYSVIDFVIKTLRDEQVTLSTPLYRDMLTDLQEGMQKQAVVPCQFFLNSPKEAFSKEASHLLSDKYMMADEGKEENTDASIYNTTTESLDAQVKHILRDYRGALLDIAMKKVMDQLSDEAVKQDAQKCMSLMMEQMQIKKKIQELSNGSKVFTRRF